MVRQIGLYNWRINLDLILSAISHKTRRKLLKELTAHPSHISTLAAQYDLSVSTMSEHISILQKAGLVTKVRHGKGIILLAAPGRLLTVKKYLDNYREYWERIDRETYDITIDG